MGKVIMKVWLSLTYLPMQVGIAQWHEYTSRAHAFDFVLYRQKASQLGSGCGSDGVEQSLPIPEVHGSNPVIDKILHTEHIEC